MRTDVTRVLGSTTVRAVVTVGALIDLHERFGTISRISDRVVDLDIRVILPTLTLLIVEGGVEATKAHEQAVSAIEQAGLVAVANFISELMRHACDKAGEAVGEGEGSKEIKHTSTPS